MFSLFWNDLMRQRKRFIMTAMAIVWGTISMVLFLSFGEGMQRQFKVGSQGLGVGIVIMGGGSTGKPWKGLGTGRPIRFAIEDMDLIKERFPEIERISGELQQWGKSYTYGKVSVTSRITGVFPDYKEMRTNFPEEGGRFINDIDVKERRRVIFLGTVLRDKLFNNENAVGKIITVDRIPFLVIGVMEKKIQMSMYSGPDDQQAIIPATTFSALYGERYYQHIIYQPRNPQDTEKIKYRLRQTFAAKYKFDPTDTRAIWNWDTIESEKITNAIMTGLKIFLGIVGGMTLIIAGGGVANMMYVVVRQRTREIGIKIAMGAKRRNILLPFLVEAIMIMLSGGVFGIPLSLLLIKAYGLIPTKQLTNMLLGQPIVSLNVAFGTVIILGILGLLAGIFPARKAASLNPVEALRYE